MIKGMVNWVRTQRRLMRSANALKTYFERRLNVPLELLVEPPEAFLDQDVRFGLHASAYGLWGLRPSQPLEVDTRTEISDTFEAILGAMDDMEQQREELHRMQTNLQRALEEVPSNVVPLRRALHLAAVSPKAAKRWIVKADCLIESPNLDEVRKLALELHSHDRRLAFLDYETLDKNERVSLEHLRELGEVHLFIQNILDLTLNEQKILTILCAQNASSRPLLTVGTPQPYSDLLTDPKVDPQFLNSIGRAYIKLSKPFAEYRDQGLIHYFLDSLSQSPT